jgi:hypothetical protein
VYRYEIAWIGIKDVSNPMPILYVDPSTEYGLFPSCPCVPTPNMHPDIRDRVESYGIHMLLTRRLRITFVALILSLIISKQRVTSSVPLLLTGVVHPNVGQKLLIRYKIKSFLDVQSYAVDTVPTSTNAIQQPLLHTYSYY